jgi:intein-encoded DNA endonuclease-like protein
MNNKTGKRYAYKIGHWAKANQSVLTMDQELEIVRLYREEKKKVSEILTVFRVSRETIARVLRKHNTQRRSRSEELTKYSENSHYFHEIDAPDKAYWLGFIAADGCVVLGSSHHLTIGLHARDFQHLVKFKESIQSDRPVKLYTPEKSCVRAVICVNNETMVADLMCWGVVPRKSNIVTFPENLPMRFYRDYIRGYVDGDGCITLSKGHLSFDLCGSESMMKSIQGILVKECYLKSTKISTYKGKKLFHFSYGGNWQVPRIIHYLYHDATMYLDRKAKYYFMLQGSQTFFDIPSIP